MNIRNWAQLCNITVPVSPWQPLSTGAIVRGLGKGTSCKHTGTGTHITFTIWQALPVCSEWLGDIRVWMIYPLLALTVIHLRLSSTSIAMQCNVCHIRVSSYQGALIAHPLVGLMRVNITGTYYSDFTLQRPVLWVPVPVHLIRA